MSRWKKLGIIAGVLAVLMAVLAVSARKGINHFLYPLAPSMPPVVNDPMANILAALECVLQTNAPEVLAGLQPGLTVAQITKLENQYHIQLPPDIEAIYEWRDGARESTNNVSVDIIPIHRFLPLEEALEDRASFLNCASPGQKFLFDTLLGFRASWVCLFSDGSRDGYWFDPMRKPSEGAVFSTFIEENDYVFFPSAKNLMAGIVRCYQEKVYWVKSGASLAQVDEDLQRADKIWGEFGTSNLP